MTLLSLNLYCFPGKLPDVPPDRPRPHAGLPGEDGPLPHHVEAGRILWIGEGNKYLNWSVKSTGVGLQSLRVSLVAQWSETVVVETT